ncbi:efflux RND transporter periplasmic adaptor subunit [Chitinibacter bivalviorum]|uniref:Efflux RND transporter periplasmic adaptor subunit n=1 Tax=Chitinibacter bivalviorum TaxID=2739434 RepID=A0A7H9BIT7_9NEIS|nr:efflux RND transporter periplasmic adaptor subunit [Chitinibacter bivalviorum]QLG87474.1 efflux RND transporter periplasmic adaptor subunit [Chitinibacter bivalviorum]
MHQPSMITPKLTTLSIIISGLLLTACGQKTAAPPPPPAPVSVIKIEPTSAPMSFELVGETAGYRDVEVRSRVNGILLKRTYVEGQSVNAGQTLFEIDPEPYKAALDQAKGGLSIEVARLEKARADRDRIIPLFKENAVSRKDYDDAMTAYAAAVASQQSAEAKVREAELNLGYTKVVAPISGMTSTVAQSEGSLVSTAGESGKLTTISQLDPMYVTFSYSEEDRQRLEQMTKAKTISMGDSKNIKASINLSNGAKYEQVGKIDFSDNRVDPKTGTIRARAIFSNPHSQLLPGQFVRLTLDIGKINNAILIPERAIVQSQADKLVMTVDKENKVSPRTIKVGRADAQGQVRVESGLQAGDVVIVEGILKVKPGAIVKPMPASAPQASQAQAAQ